MRKIFPIIIILIIVSLFMLINSSNQEVISTSDEEYLVVGDEVFVENRPVFLENNIIYISLDFIMENIDPNIYYDSNEETIILTNKEKVVRFKVGEDIATINQREFYINQTIKLVEEQPYISDEILTNYYPIDINYFEDTKAVVIEEDISDHMQGQIIAEGGNIRVNFDKKSPILLRDIPLETEVLIFEEFKDWYKIRTYDGVVGYIEKKYLKINLGKKHTEFDKTPKDEYIMEKRRINLTWDYTHRKMTKVENAEHIDGINVLSPTWFSIVDNKGNILDKGNLEYVSEYKLLGYEIWPLIDNSFDPNLTQELLSSSKTRENLIKEIAYIYDKYDVDGINIDFENIYLEDRRLLTQFVRELYPIFKEMNMVVSIDVTPISTSENWSLSFDRKELSKTVDYIMLMAYDQHWASSPVAGSVAQYNWVEKSIVNVLEEIPNDKLILGIPFYTRLWKVDQTKDGEKISSQALSMEKANNFIEENNIKLEWDEGSGQYYGETTIQDILYKIWVEDGKSIKLKSTLVNKYDLAGIASWRKGFETEDIWSVLSNTIKLN